MDSLSLFSEPNQIVSLSTERLFDLIERAPLAMVLLDPWQDDGLRIVSEGLANLLGYSAEEFSSRRLREIRHPDDPGAAEMIEQLRTGARDRFQVQCRYRHKDGHYLWLLATGATIRGAEGEPLYILGYLADIDPTKRSEEALRRAAQLQQTLTSNLPNTTVALIDRELNVLAVEGQSERSIAHREAVGQKLDQVSYMRPGQLDNLVRHVRLALEGEEQEYRVTYEHGAFHTTVSPLFDAEGNPYAAVLVGRDVTSEHQAHQQLRRLARFDSLTGLSNRDAFRERLAESLAVPGPETALIFLDIDNFKQVNDSLGHDAGDELLRVVADRVRACVSESDEVFRLSGDEFTVILSGEGDCGRLGGLAQRIIDAIAMPVWLSDHELFPSASLGIASSDQVDSDGGDLLKAADMAMYAAKREGRNTYRFFETRMAAAAKERLRLSSHLHRAVERGELVLHYLPQLSLPDERVVSVEALVRWCHPERGLMQPLEFIPLAEETGLIVELGAWVLERACCDVARWRAEGLPDLRVAVNVSAPQLTAKLPAQVRAALDACDLPASALELEITESALMDGDLVEPVLRALKQMGVVLAIDDFGTGYSSLSRLRSLPIDMLKVDRSFVSDLPESADAAALVRSIIALAGSLGVLTLAEGVETAAQRDHLSQEGCRMAAGWLWSRPIPAEEMPAQLAEVAQALMLSRT